MKKKLIKILLLVLVVLFSGIIAFLILNRNIFKNKEIAIIDFKSYTGQKDINEELLSYYNDDKYTFNSPKIIIDPYKRSPLSALIIFKTQSVASIDVYINDVFVTQMEKAKNHSIPIIGLIENYENVIRLVCNKDEKIINIKTEKQNIEYEYEASDKNGSPIFFASAKNMFSTTNEGKLNWLINEEYYNFQISKSKNIYYVDESQRIVESDFLGKIKRIYLLPTTVDYHYLVQLSNNNYLMNTNDGNILEMNYQTGEIVKEYDLKKLLLSVDENFKVSTELHVNYIDYHESEEYMVISMRGLDAILKYNIRKEKIEWILTNNELFSDKFNEYKLNLIYGRYPKGQHTTYLIGNKLYLFNNDYGLFETGIPSESSASIYEINGKNIQEIYEYKNGIYSYAFGSFNTLKNNNKLINFGFVFYGNDAFVSKTYEINNSDEIIQCYKFKTPLYRAFEDSFYNEHTNNYTFENVKAIKNKNMNLKKYLVNIPRYKLITAPKNGLLISVKNSNITINPDIFKCTTDDIRFLFIGADKSYCFPYKIKDNNNVFNINNYLIKMKGKYAIYAIINDEYYDTNMVVNIK